MKHKTVCTIRRSILSGKLTTLVKIFYQNLVPGQPKM
jgi:hypothetical protein